MNLRNLILLLSLLLSFSGYSQSKDKFVYSSSTLNFYPKLKPYSFFSTIETMQDNLVLDFLTSNSGTFVLEDYNRTVENELVSEFPSQLFNFGLSVQIRNANSTFQEVSVSRFSSFKSSHSDNYTVSDSTGREQVIVFGYEQKSFVMSLRYEFGKMFGKGKSPFRFGLSGMIEPSFHRYRRTPRSIREYPIKANLTAIHIALVPIGSFKLSKKVYLDIKLIPRFLLADFGEISMKNPILTLSQQIGEREYSLPEIDIAGTVQLRFVLKEPKKKRRRRSED